MAQCHPLVPLAAAAAAPAVASAPVSPDAVRAGAPEDRRRASRPRPSHPCPDAQRGRLNRPRFDPSSRAVHGRALERRRYRVSVAVIGADEQSLGTVRRLLRVRERAPDRRLIRPPGGDGARGPRRVSAARSG